MAIYAIGDVQGCLTPLKKLLALINFDSATDTLWFTGDLVNRGPQSLEVLRFVYNLGEKQQTVLGNHDLHLLAVAYGVRPLHKNDTLTSILEAPDRDQLLSWLRHRPLLWQAQDYLMVHAGLAPSWDIAQAAQLAKEVEVALQTDTRTFLQDMYGNLPNRWENQLIGKDRLRCIVNYLTRVRFCYDDGRLDFQYKGDLEGKPVDLFPWFTLPSRRHMNAKIIFGHWAALMGKTQQANLFPLDTGCVWGHCLTAMRLSDQQYFKVSCK